MMEVVVSTLLVGTMLVVSLSASGNLLRSQSKGTDAVTAQKLLTLFVNEITANAFSEPSGATTLGPDAGESTSLRHMLDDVDDYDGLTLTSPTNVHGTVLPQYAGWTLQVSVAYADTTESGYVAVATNTAPLRSITVTATAPSGFTVSRVAVVANTEQSLGGLTTYERRRTVSVVTSSATVECNIPMRNLPIQSGGS